MFVVLIRQVAEAVTRDRARAQNHVAKECDDAEADFASGLVFCFEDVHVSAGRINSKNVVAES